MVQETVTDNWLQQLEDAAQVPSSGKGVWKIEIEYSDGELLSTYAIFWHPGDGEMSVPIAEGLEAANAQAICDRRNAAASTLAELRRLALCEIDLRSLQAKVTQEKEPT